MSEVKKWPDECWRWTQERPIIFGDIWWALKHPIKLIRLAHFALYSILKSKVMEMEAKGIRDICYEHLIKEWKKLDNGEPLGKPPLWNLFH